MFDRDGFYKEVGLRLQLARRRRELTQQQVADAVGVPRASYANVERGRQTVALDLIWRIAVYFDQPIDELCPEPLPGSPVSRDGVWLDPAEFDQSAPIYVRTKKPMARHE